MVATFVVETGAGLPNSNSYASEVAADQEIENLETSTASTAWLALSQTAKEAALRDATAYCDQRFGRRWLGQRTNGGQALDWPRFDVVDYDGFLLDSGSIPAKLIQAVSLLAVQSSEGTELWADLTSPGRIKRKKVKAGPVEQDIEYVGGSSQTIKFTRIDALLADFVENSSIITRS